MPSTIVFNQASIVGTGNNTFEYKFPSSVNFNNHEIAVESISINYSWVNISAALHNNAFQYVWYDTTGPVTYTIQFDDGLYELSQLNSKMQYEMIKNGTLLFQTNMEESLEDLLMEFIKEMTSEITGSKRRK